MRCYEFDIEIESNHSSDMHDTSRELAFNVSTIPPILDNLETETLPQCIQCQGFCFDEGETSNLERMGRISFDRDHGKRVEDQTQSNGDHLIDGNTTQHMETRQYTLDAQPNQNSGETTVHILAQSPSPSPNPNARVLWMQTNPPLTHLTKTLLNHTLTQRLTNQIYFTLLHP